MKRVVVKKERSQREPTSMVGSHINVNNIMICMAKAMDLVLMVLQSSVW